MCVIRHIMGLAATLRGLGWRRRSKRLKCLGMLRVVRILDDDVDAGQCVGAPPCWPVPTKETMKETMKETKNFGFVMPSCFDNTVSRSDQFLYAELSRIYSLNGAQKMVLMYLILRRLFGLFALDVILRPI